MAGENPRVLTIRQLSFASDVPGNKKAIRDEHQLTEERFRVRSKPLYYTRQVDNKRSLPAC